jgi:SAM-dependent methyltransferase
VDATPLPFYDTPLAVIHGRDFGDFGARAATAILRRLHARGFTTGTIVDVGCGAGVAAAAFWDAGFTVVAFDRSPAMVELTRRAAPAALVSVGTLDTVRVPSNCVAICAISEVLSYAPSAAVADLGLDHFLDVAASSLCPGGFAAFDLVAPGRFGPEGRWTLEQSRDDWRLTVSGVEDRVRRTVDRRISGAACIDGVWEPVEEQHRQITTSGEQVEAAAMRAGLTCDVADSYDDQRMHGVTVAWCTKL